MPSDVVENYLKQIYLAQEEDRRQRVPTGRLAKRLGVLPGTVTAMLKSLSEKGLVDYEPYGGVRLSAAGSRLARKVICRHRLIETWLVQELGISWTDVHQEAERLEHAFSDLVIERLDEKLGRPVRDPHGDPIPRQGKSRRSVPTRDLLHAPVDTELRVARISDQDPEFLKELERLGLKPGGRLVVRGHNDQTDTLQVQVAGGKKIELGSKAAAKVFVETYP